MLTSEEAKVIISGSIAYSSQKPWIMSKTLKENVTFLAPFDEKRLKTVINYACLSEDLKMLPRGLETEIG
jgi:ABC-type multidrug transport system fused ATPase/permease subunit